MITTTGAWIGVDLDGTLAHYRNGEPLIPIGKPIPAMLERVKKWITEGRRVKIMTARMAIHGEWDFMKPGGPEAKEERDSLLVEYPNIDLEDDECVRAWDRVGELEIKYTIDMATPVQDWCEEQLGPGQRLEVTNVKDLSMIELWDDRAVQVEMNTGRRADGKE